MLNITLLFTGIEAVNIKKHEPPSHILEKRSMIFTANILENPVEKKKSFRVLVCLIAVKDNSKAAQLDDKAVLYIQKDSSAMRLRTGDQMVFETIFSDIPTPSNPNEYDFRKNMNNRQIYLQAYLPSGKWNISGTGKGNIFILLSDRLRSKLLAVYKTYGLSGKEYAVLSALTLGYRDELDNETIQAFSASGAIHILSVSGLHVGIIFFLIDYLLIFLRKSKPGSVLRLVIILGFLWFYALIAGLVPCILRATVMFSFVIIGKTVNRDAGIQNILAISAFFLLLYDPFMVLDVGFELSYIAVIGIVYLYPGIFHLCKFRNLVASKAWSLIAVSLAAQIATFPLSLYYFHQFPNYFILTNLVVIPLSTAIMYIAVAILIFSFIHPFAGLLGYTLKYSVYTLNYSVEFIENLPCSVTGGIGINANETVLLYLLVILIALFLFTRLLKYLRAVLILTALLLISLDIQSILAYGQRKICVFNIRNCSVISFIDGKKNYILSSSASVDDISGFDYYLKNFLIMQRTVSPVYINRKNIKSGSFESGNLFIGPDIVQFYSRKILIINHPMLNNTQIKKGIFDFVVLSSNVNVPLETIVRSKEFKLLILDSSNSPWRIKKWESECKKLGIPFYSVPGEGALILDL